MAYTREQIIEKFRKVHGNKYNYDKVIFTKTTNNVIITCPIHGDFEQTPHAHLKGQGCPKCGVEKRAKLKTLNTDIFVKRAKEIYGDTIDYSKAHYVNSRTPINLICPIHGEFQLKANDHLNNGRGCPKCGNLKKGGLKRMLKEEFVEKVRAIHGNKYDYSKVEYINNRTKVCIICPKHGEFWQEPWSHIDGHGCPKCANEKLAFEQTFTTEQFIEKAKVVHGNKYDYSHTIYQGYSNPVTIICPKHGEFQQIASYHLNGNGCQRCGLEMQVSNSEIEIRDFICNILKNTEIKFNNRSVLSGHYELDIYIPSKKLAIEYDGIFWHSEAKKSDASYHLTKTEECEAKGVRLIHIFEDEWLEHEDIVKSRLSNILGLSVERIFARKCELREVSSSDSRDFLNANHIQGNVNAKHRFGLYYNGELVSLMTFGNLRKNLGGTSKEGSYELLRFCNKLNTTVVGGASKLFKHFIDEYHPTEVISYADRRWSSGRLYEKLGFEFVHNTQPSYYYVINGKRHNRFAFRKDRLIAKYGCPPEITEHEFCLSKGWYRIYDCGTLKYVWTNGKEKGGD